MKTLTIFRAYESARIRYEVYTLNMHRPMDDPYACKLWRQYRKFQDKLVERLKQESDLLMACETAMEWAANYPLSGAFGVMDKWAADEVYEQCKTAIFKVKGETP